MQVIAMLAVAVVLVTTFPAMAIDAAGEVEIPVDLVQAPTVASTSSTVAFAAAPVTLPTVTPIHTVPGQGGSDPELTTLIVLEGGAHEDQAFG